MWQSLAFGANYKAAYCLAACPAGEDVMAPFLRDRKEFVREVVKPLQDKLETVYVIPGSDAESHAARRYPHKQVKRVRNSLTPVSVKGFRFGLPLVFQPNQAHGLNATYHFLFHGHEADQFTVVIADQACRVEDGLVDQPDLLVKADSETWIGFLRKERSLIMSLLTGRISLEGNLRMLLRFARCFPT
jgi:hypothetical protein